VNLIENIISLSPMTTIVVAWLFVPQSFDLRVAGAALVATGAIIWGYWHKHKLELSKAARLLILSVLFMSVENVLAGVLLQERAISPVTLFAIRTEVMGLFFMFFYKTQVFTIGWRNTFSIALIALVGTAMMLFRYYGLRDSGIVYTSFVLVLVPFIVLVGSTVFLHEKLHPKQMLTISIVLLAVLYATML
jgi:drug/metabolite transporter (DMT)-like permease